MRHPERRGGPKVDCVIDVVHRRGGDEDLLGERTDHGCTRDPIPDRHALDAGTDEAHDAGELAPRCERHWDTDLVLIGDQQDIGEVRRRRHDVDHHLALTRHRVGQVLHHQHVGGPVLDCIEVRGIGRRTA